ncbi:O-linked N-acetylglucosamine transferase, SPINDLY family protein [Rhizobium sp. PAMB 3174]
MSALLQQALIFYKAGDFARVTGEIAPDAVGLTKPEPQLSLVLAQSFIKQDLKAEAADWYCRAAGPMGEKGAQLLTLAADLYARCRKPALAIEAARAAMRLTPNDPKTLEIYRKCLREDLLFEECAASNADLFRRLQAGDPAALALEKPLDHISWCADEAINARITRMDGLPFDPAIRAARRARPHRWGDRIRIGYLSNDFSSAHATMILMQGVLAAHDRAAFDVTLFCHTPEALIARDSGLRTTYGRIVPIGHLSDEDAARLIRATEIDILVDLKGHTKDARLGLVNSGLAPIQAAWLGFPGSGTGIDCDYVISDRIVTPDTSKPHYLEKLCRLPDSYQPNDNRYRPLPAAADRAALGLPPDRFIFASFSEQRKITPDTFGLWMHILRATGDSLLWLKIEDPFVRQNILDAAQKAGIDESRIVFTGWAAYGDHLARLQAADLCLDTFPYNGHTTTSDALWAGLPVATRRGTHFASRVSESLLSAAGLADDLVAGDDDGFVELCVGLCKNPERLTGIRRTLASNRTSAPLFDTERFTRHLERAYTMMAERARAGLEPDHIDVPPIDRPAAS